MIVDVHTHTPTHRGPVPPEERQVNTVWRPDRAVEAAVSWDDYLRAMEPVDRAIVFGIAFRGGREPPGREGVGIAWRGANVNDLTAAFVRAHPEKLIGFLSVHPDEPDALEELERAVFDLGLRGIKLGPNYQHFEPLGASARRLYARATELGLPVLFHQGTSPMRTAPLRFAHPLVMDEIALAFPDLKIVMAHLGHPWQVDTFAVVRKHPNVYADVSAAFYRPWSMYNALRLATEWGVLDKLLFGTDYPIATPAETIAGLRGVNRVLEGTALPRVPEDQIEAIIHRDALTLLGLAG